MKKIIAFSLLFSLFIFVNGKKLTTLNEISKPNMLSIEGNNFLITEGTSVFIYSLKDFSLVKKFGKEGEGPREFKISQFGPPMIAYFYKGKIFISSSGKISKFTLNGNFIDEMKIPPFSVARPFLDKFIATGTAENDKGKTALSVNLLDSKMNRIKILYKSDFEIGPNMSYIYPLNNFSFEPYKDKLFMIRGKDGFVIDVFNKEGSILYTIKKEEPKIKVDKEYREKTIDSFKTNPNTKQYWEFFKNRIKFKDYYPPVQGIRVVDDLIYLLTYKTDKGRTECIIMDLKGKILKRVFVPMPMLYGMDYMPKFSFSGKRFYYLKENEDEEIWELFSEKIF